MDETWRQLAKQKSQSQKEKHCIISLTWSTYNNIIHKDGK